MVSSNVKYTEFVIQRIEMHDHWFGLLNGFTRGFKTQPLDLFSSAGFMQSSSSTMFQTFPSGSPRASSLVTSSSLKTHLMSATSTSTSLMTGNAFEPYVPMLLKATVELVWHVLLCPRSLNVDMEWLYGASESSNMEVDIGYLPQVQLQWCIST